MRALGGLIAAAKRPAFTVRTRRLRTALLKRMDLLALSLVLVATLLARLIPALVMGTEVADLSIYRRMALVVIREEDIYDFRNLFPYTPLSLFIPSFALGLSDRTGLPFHLVMKLFPLAGDIGTATLVVLLARHRWGTLRATMAGLAFALNPVSILITGFHGNIMPLSVFFAFWAYYLLEVGEGPRTYVLGIGIGLRGWPGLLVPFLLRPGQLSWRQRAIYVAVAFFPSALTLAPYWLVNSEGITRELFSYQSTPDFGWVAIRRAAWFLDTGNRDLPGTQTTDWIDASRTYFVAAYTVLVALAFLRPRLLETAGWCATALILAYSAYGGIAAQYYVWVVPFLALYVYGAAFSLVTTGAIITFYLNYHPGILLGPYDSPVEYSLEEITRWELWFLLATWGAGILWLLWVLIRAVNQGRRLLVSVRPG